MSLRTLIIAEAGVNHNGDFSLAKQLVDAAGGTGADLVKFQTFSPDRLLTQDVPMAEYQSQAMGNVQSQFFMLKKLELTPRMYQDLIVHCRSRSIEFFSTGLILRA